MLTKNPISLDPNATARQALQDHYELVKSVVPKYMLLEYEVQEGWAPLYDVLGREVFPKVSGVEQFSATFEAVGW